MQTSAPSTTEQPSATTPCAASWVSFSATLARWCFAISSHTPLATNAQGVQQATKTPDFRLLHFPGLNGQTLVDLSITSSVQSRFLGNHPAGAAADRRDADKCSKYAQLARSTDHLFLPASMETTGGLSKGFRFIIDEWVRRHDRAAFAQRSLQLTWACSSYRQECYQRLAVALWSGALRMKTARERAIADRAPGAVAAPLFAPPPSAAHVAVQAAMGLPPPPVPAFS
jgi:hypothetical protein